MDNQDLSQKAQHRRGCDILHPYSNRTDYSDLFCRIVKAMWDKSENVFCKKTFLPYFCFYKNILNVEEYRHQAADDIGSAVFRKIPLSRTR